MGVARYTGVARYLGVASYQQKQTDRETENTVNTGDS